MIPIIVSFITVVIGTIGVIIAGTMSGEQFALAFISGQIIGAGFVCLVAFTNDYIKSN